MESAPEQKTTRVENPHLTEAKRHARSARQEMRQAVEALLPTGVVEHRRAARREFLMAMRSMIDAAIDRLENRDRTI